MSKMSATHFKTVVGSALDAEKACYHCFLDAMLEEGRNSLRDCHLATTFSLPTKKTHFDDGWYYFSLVYQCDNREDMRDAALAGAKRLVDLTKIPWREVENEFLNGPLEIPDVPTPPHKPEPPRSGPGLRNG